MTTDAGSSPSFTTKDPVRAAAMASGVHVEGLTKTFTGNRGVTAALGSTDLTTSRGSVLAVIGPPGCGKSTLIRLLAGLETPTSGRVLLHGVPPAELQRRHELSLARQDSPLLPWRSVSANIRLPLEAAGRTADPRTVDDLAHLVGLRGFEDARPAQLSPGMRRRVLIAQCLALQPSVLLLDEPFGAVDGLARQRLGADLLRIWTERPVTTVLVTSAVTEAVLLGDSVALLGGHPGRVMQEVRIDLPRPRTAAALRTAPFRGYTERLVTLLADLGSTPD